MKIRDILKGAREAFVVCPSKGETVRHITVVGDDAHILAGNDAIKVSLDTVLKYEPWFMDRGSILFEHPDLGTLKFCTELDILRLPDGTESQITIPVDTRKDWSSHVYF